jgi:U3 small nucleolar ribonucleoprotein component
VQEAKKLFMMLQAKLDGLAHLGLGRKPVTSELEVNIDAAAIAMEDVAPVILSAAHLRAPEEVHAKVCATAACFGYQSGICWFSSPTNSPGSPLRLA